MKWEWAINNIKENIISNVKASTPNENDGDQNTSTANGHDFTQLLNGFQAVTQGWQGVHAKLLQFY